MRLRTISAVTLAFTFAVAIGGLYTFFGFESIDQNFIWGLLLIVPIWIAVGAFLYALDKPQRGVTWLTAANLACYAILATQASVGR